MSKMRHLKLITRIKGAVPHDEFYLLWGVSLSIYPGHCNKILGSECLGNYATKTLPNLATPSSRPFLCRKCCISRLLRMSWMQLEESQNCTISSLSRTILPSSLEGSSRTWLFLIQKCSISLIWNIYLAIEEPIITLNIPGESQSSRRIYQGIQFHFAKERVIAQRKLLIIVKRTTPLEWTSKSGQDGLEMVGVR